MIIGIIAAVLFKKALLFVQVVPRNAPLIYCIYSLVFYKFSHGEIFLIESIHKWLSGLLRLLLPCDYGTKLKPYCKWQG